MVYKRGYLPAKRQLVVDEVPPTPLYAKEGSTFHGQEEMDIPLLVVKYRLINFTAHI